MKALILIWSLLLPYMAFGQATSSDTQYRNDGETLINGSFEQGKKGYTLSVGSGSLVWSTQSTTSLNGKAMQLTLSAQTFSFKSATTQGVKFQNQSGVVEVYISASASGAEVCPLLDGTSETVGSNQCMPIIHNVGFKPYVMQRVFGATSLNYEIRNASGAFTGNIFIDDGSVAKKSLVANLSGAQFYGSVEFAENCDWSQTSTTSYQSYTNDSVCTITTLGDILAPSINIPAFRFKTNTKLGKYLILASVPTYSQVSSGTPRSYFQPFYDGVAIGSEAILLNQASGASLSTLSTFSNTLTISSPLTSEKVFEIRHKTNGGSNARVNTDATSKTRFDVYFYPDQPISTINDTNGWFIDANIGGALINVGTGGVSSFTEITNSSLDLVINTSKGSAPAEIPCASGTASVGLTCNTPAVAESVGLAFVPPKTGKYRACVSASHQVNNVGVTFQLIETSNTSSAIVAEGGDRVNFYSTTTTSIPTKVCGNFTFNDTSKKTLRLMFEQTAGGATSQVLADRVATEGQRDIRITVEPIVENIQASLQGYISNPSAINPKIVSFTFAGATIATTCTSASCVIYENNGAGAVTVSRSATGRYQVQWPTGTWSNSNYVCTYGGYGGVTGICGTDRQTAKSQTTLNVYGGTSGFLDTSCELICIGQ